MPEFSRGFLGKSRFTGLVCIGLGQSTSACESGFRWGLAGLEDFHCRLVDRVVVLQSVGGFLGTLPTLMLAFTPSPNMGLVCVVCKV